MTAAITAFYGFDGENEKDKCQIRSFKISTREHWRVVTLDGFITVDRTEDSGTE